MLSRLNSGHVAAKRALCAQRSACRRALSSASLETLRRQVGPMGRDERRAFEQDPLAEDLIALRHWDEAAKLPGALVAPLDHYRPMLCPLLSTPISTSTPR